MFLDKFFRRPRLASRFAHLPLLSEHEVGRPHARIRNPIEAGKLEFLVQPLYDWISVAVNTITKKETLFSIPIGQSYTGSGVAALSKTLFHTNLVQAGQLDAPKKFLVKALAVVPRSDIHATDLAALMGQFQITFFVSGKDYWNSTVAKTPAGAGGYFGGFGTFASGTSLQLNSNGWPSAQNVATITDPVPQIPGLPAMEPILGVLIEQQQNFSVILDPTLQGTAPTAQNTAGAVAGTVGNGLNVHTYLEGVLARAVL